MKKLIVGLLAAFLMASGLVAMSSSGAQASCVRYGGCPGTTTSINGPSVGNRGESVKFVTSTVARGSNATPRGTVRIYVKGAGKRTANFSFSQAKRVGPGNTVKQFKFGKKFGPGKYTVKAFFSSNGGFQDSRSRVLGLKIRNN